MPLYDYQCQQCAQTFEARHGFDDPAPPCPACGSPQVTRLILTAPTVAQGINAHPGDGRRATKAQLQDKWAEETPRLRRKLVDKLGEETVRKNAPSLGGGSE